MPTRSIARAAREDVPADCPAEWMPQPTERVNVLIRVLADCTEHGWWNMPGGTRLPGARATATALATRPVLPLGAPLHSQLQAELFKRAPSGSGNVHELQARERSGRGHMQLLWEERLGMARDTSERRLHRILFEV